MSQAPLPIRVPLADFPTRFAAFEHQATWCFLEAGEVPSWPHWTELAVYSNQQLGLHVEVGLHPVHAEGGRPYFAECTRTDAGRFATLWGFTFQEVMELAGDWLEERGVRA